MNLDFFAYLFLFIYFLLVVMVALQWQVDANKTLIEQCFWLLVSILNSAAYSISNYFLLRRPHKLCFSPLELETVVPESIDKSLEQQNNHS